MDKEREKRASLLERVQEAGGLQSGVSLKVFQETGIPEAEVYGTASFYHLLADADVKLRICTDLTCRMAGADKLLAEAEALGIAVSKCSCLAACDRAPVALQQRHVLPGITSAQLEQLSQHPDALSEPPGIDVWRGEVGPLSAPSEELALELWGPQDLSGQAFARCLEMGPEETIAQIKASGLQGRGGAGFPAHIKWTGVRGQEETERYVVLNADEGEPGTFKDREVMLRRPDLVLEGLAIAAHTVGASHVYLYLRGEFGFPMQVIEQAIADATEQRRFGDIQFHTHSGHGAYICGEETALLEALEGKRGMPRLKPPYPVSSGLWGKPTLIHNVETIACVPRILLRGGDWFRSLGRTEAGTKLYNVSGHVQRPGTYELPLGVCLDELVEAAGGYVGTLKAFSPGGASSGFLPASERQRPLDFRSLSEIGSMLGSSGVVVMNDTVDMKDAVLAQLNFFAYESCGQCAPCRIGTHYLHDALKKAVQADGSFDASKLQHVGDVAWQMGEGSICGLGQTASLPLTSALKYFPGDF